MADKSAEIAERAGRTPPTLDWYAVPWRIAEGPAEVRHADGWLVCEVSADSHARLIAAAPKTLEAAKLAMEGVEVIDLLIASIEQHGNYSVESTLGFLNQARCAKLRLGEAIAKAEGRS